MSSAEMKSPMPAPIYGSSEVKEVSTDPFGGNGRDTTWHLVMSDRVAFLRKPESQHPVCSSLATNAREIFESAHGCRTVDG